MPANRSQLKNVLQKPYDRLLLAKEVLKPIFNDGFNFFDSLIPSEHKATNSEAKVVDEVNIYGRITLEDGTEITCYEIKLQPKVRIEKSKILIQQYVRKLLTAGQAALINFISPSDSNVWRLTLVAKDSILTDDGIKEKFTEAKRYTYLVGPAENCRTVSERLETLSIEKSLNFESLVKAFSVEKLNKDFYRDISEQFYRLIGATVGKGKNVKVYERLLQLPVNGTEASRTFQEFAVRLIGRTVFCWFLKVKKSEDGIPLLPEHLLSSDAVKNYPSYYHTILEKLFFQILNTPIGKRISNLPKGSGLIPFLNGGLFEAQFDDYYKPNTSTGLSLNNTSVSIPDEWFIDFFEKLEQYNFTIDENSIVDVEVSVDPEMLGSIFENLLAEIDPDSGETARKATGSFYTPRQIVDYMATESLVYYLQNTTSLDPAQLTSLFNIGDSLNFSALEKEKVLIALDNVKILDPACGSGAFPIGMLQKIVLALQRLDKDAEWWIEKQVMKYGDSSSQIAFREKLQKNADYARKIGIIQNNLYGVDIQPIAAEISKLRCFLTLIVDEHIDESKPNRGVEPLPNLEFKFVTADTLLKLPEETNQVPIYNSKKRKNPLELLADLRTVRSKYLQSYGEEKQELKRSFQEIQKELFDQQGFFGHVENNRAYKIANWRPFSHEKTDWFDPNWMFGIEGFNIIIGNPPYGTVYGKERKKRYENLYASFKRNLDIYVAFIESSENLLAESGTLTFITPNTYLNGDYFERLRQHITEQYVIQEIIDFKNSKIFSDPTVYVCITTLIKSNAITYPYEFKLKLSNANFTEVFLDQVPITKSSNLPFKSTSQLISQIVHNKNAVKLDDLFYVKDVGFNYWSIGKGKKRDGNSIGDRILYSGKQQSNLDKPYIKGRDIEKFSIKQPTNYLRHDFERYLSEGDVFRYSEAILKTVPKIVYRQTAASIIAAIDENSSLCDKTVHVIIPREGTSEFDIRYLACLLNSKLFDYLYKDVSQESGGRAFAQVKTTYIKKLPLINVTKKVEHTFIAINKLTTHIREDLNNGSEWSMNALICLELTMNLMICEIYFHEEFYKSGIGKNNLMERITQVFSQIKEEKTFPRNAEITVHGLFKMKDELQMALNLVSHWF